MHDYDLPGMKVLHFAFGDDMPKSGYVPHHHVPNAVVYTGTHDNNTTRGWFRKRPTRRRPQTTVGVPAALGYGQKRGQ